MSIRGDNWHKFACDVEDHINNYTVPQYGDAPDDQVEDYSVQECLRQVSKYIARFGKNSREGQQELDFIKMAHYVQLAAQKYRDMNHE